MFDKGLVLKVDNKDSGLMPINLSLLDLTNSSSIIYGRNGSGKSTISRMLNLKKNMTEFEDDMIKVQNYEGVDYSYDEIQNIHVYSEFFVDENIKFKEDGLDTIILLGEDVKVDDELNSTKKTLTNLEKQIEEIKLEDYINPKSLLNPEMYEKKIIKELKKDGVWAQRKKSIVGGNRNASVNRETISEIKRNHSERISLEAFNKQLDEYKDLSIETEICSYQFKRIQSKDKNVLLGLLSCDVERISNNELAEKIYEVIKHQGRSRIEEVEATFKEEVKYCPYCFQPVDDAYKNKIIANIKKVISGENEVLIKQLQDNYFEEFYFDELPTFIDEITKKEFYDMVKNYNKEILLVNTVINRRIEDVYTKQSFDFNNLEKITNDLMSLIERIGNSINKYNDKVKSLDELRAKLLQYNNYLAWQEIKEDYKQMIDCQSRKNIDEDRYERLKVEITNVKDTIKNLESKKNSTQIAIEEINKSLKFIFLDAHRLEVALSDNDYKVLSRGKSVQLNELSTGERNIISLCYFFVSALHGKDAEHFYSDESIFVIDDPLTSFDKENKVGIYGYIRKMIKLYLSGNIKTRFIILTHDYEVAYNIGKVFDDVNSDLIQKQQYKAYALQNFSLVSEPKLQKGRNQYKVLIENVFDYASDKCDGVLDDFSIGNSLKRLLEMFSSFEYNVGFENLKKYIGNSDIYDTLNNHMFRIIANNESHSMISAYAFEDVDRFEMFSSDEKKKTAKICFVLIYTLNKKHLESYIRTNIKIVEEWKTELENI